ncbi:hypothetical protein [Bacteroides muris (ex Afrizal et al. 2022)]|uniref:Cell surface protein n=1 Tax=Bacteroides muris (ex Afrizal et al. 2022) TaxID=2516960 RepID=A0A4V3RA46_9BACE|nr:hypothetical protein [Bacteroides muris (ex Afrizal et al. 2022)]TGX99549.1 hypothetical protein E5355_17460 [Bacteroides muris (ex Afrizal et al. 2022)]
MNKKFLSVTLFSALMIGATGTFTSCKDYDDDIKNLQEQLDKKASLEELAAKVSTLETAVNDAKTAANEAKDKAQEALDKAGSAEGGVSDDDLKALKKELQDQIDKLASLATVDAKIKELKESLASEFISEADLKKLATEVETLSVKVMALIGHRLTSLTLIPTTHINGIPSIELLTLTYTPQVFAAKNYADHAADPSKHTNRPVLDHTAVKGAKALSISTEKNEVSYKISPSIGVMKEDVKKPLFECFMSQNVTKSAPELAQNKPIEIVDYDVKDGVMTVFYKKNAEYVGKSIGTTGSAHEDGTEKFWMASLKAPIADKNLTDAEKEAGKDVYVNSEYSRIEESTVYPYLANKKIDFTKDFTTDFADEMQDGKYVHYHDSLCLYKSGNEQLVDVKQPYDKPLDLRDLVTVCYTRAENKHASHKELKEYADYGLEFRFALAKAKYLQGDRKTDEQAFGRILSDGYTLKSEVYDVELGDTEYSKTSIGREPIVRAELWDKNNGNMIAVRYIKIRWTGEKDQTIAAITFPNDTVTCKDMFQQLFSKEMNEKIYHMVKFDGGQSMSKTQFHSIYKEMEIIELRKDGKKVDLSKLAISKDATDWIEGSDKVGKDGAEMIDNKRDLVFALLQDAEDNTSYNLVWAMNPKTVGTLAYNASTKTYASTFEIDVKYIDNAGLNGDIKQTFKQTIIAPTQNFAYQGTYWKNGVGEGIFNVNPIVYATANDGGTQKDPHVYPGTADGCQLADYSHIEADLVNGFVNATTKEKPANLAQFIQYIRGCAEVKFIFDKDKLANYDYLKGFSVSKDGTQLWSSAQAATPVDTEKGENKNIGMNDAGIYDYVQVDNLAATINNLMGADAAENKKNLPWNYDETLMSGNNECSSIIRLHEKDNLNGTPAALKLIGKEVPVKLVVAYNEFNVIPVQEFEVHFINPLTIDGSISDNFIDAEVDGSFLRVAKNFTFTDWNNYPVAAENVKGDRGAYAHALYDYYAVREVKFLTEKTTTSLTWNDTTNTYEHKDGVTDGKLPTNASLKMMNWVETSPKSTATETKADPTHLAYFNNNGTPVNVDYNMFLTVNVNYKWGVLSKNDLKVIVKKAVGTPTK